MQDRGEQELQERDSFICLAPVHAWFLAADGFLRSCQHEKPSNTQPPLKQELRIYLIEMAADILGNSYLLGNMVLFSKELPSLYLVTRIFFFLVLSYVSRGYRIPSQTDRNKNKWNPEGNASGKNLSNAGYLANAFIHS